MERDRLIEENVQFAYWMAERFRGCGMEQGDIVGCCMLGLVKAARAYTPGKGAVFATFTSRVMRNEVMMELRKQARTGHMESLDAEREGSRPLAETIPDPRDGYEEVETAQMYASWVRFLTEQEREAARLLFLEELSQADAAQKLGVSQSYVSRIAKRAEKKMERMRAR